MTFLHTLTAPIITYKYIYGMRYQHTCSISLKYGMCIDKNMSRIKCSLEVHHPVIVNYAHIKKTLYIRIVKHIKESRETVTSV